MVKGFLFFSGNHNPNRPPTPMHTYLFYDIETTGLNKAFDQVLQFSAVRTDSNFKELERTDLTVRLRPDTIVSPGALITHRIGISKAQEGLTEYEATALIHRLFNAPGTVSLGYNTLGFDDEFLRFSFHRNLFAPYTHQYKNGCRRMDLFPITIVFHLYKPEVLEWPRLNGKTTLKLEHLSSANRLTTGRAHEALADVMATLALAQRFSEHQEMWQYLTGCFHKATDAERVSRLPAAHVRPGCRHVTGLLISGEFGPALRYQVPVLYLGDSLAYPNQSLWLRLDLPELQRTSPDTVSDTTWVVRKRMGEPPLILPPHTRYLDLFDEDRRRLMGENLQWLLAHDRIFKEITAYYQQFRYPEIPDLDPDAALYQLGFMSPAEAQLCAEFHAAPPPGKARFVSRFQREEIRQLAARVLFRNYPDFAPSGYGRDFSTYMQRVNAHLEEEALQDFKGDRRMTPLAALRESETLSRNETLDPEQRRLLAELAGYLKRCFVIDKEG
jgi:exodeoxyribonuclease-1